MGYAFKVVFGPQHGSVIFIAHEVKSPFGKVEDVKSFESGKSFLRSWKNILPKDVNLSRRKTLQKLR